MPFFYRFRSIDTLLGERQELEQQQVYFCPPDELNDPVEGYKDLFWQGDEIVWRNLIRHYLLCLTQAVALASVAGKDYSPDLSRGFVFTTPSSLPTDRFKDIYQRICAAFFSAHTLDQIPALLAKRTFPFRREELEFCLRGLHAVAINSVIKIFREENLMPPASAASPAPEFSEKTVVDGLTRVLNAINGSNIDSEALCQLFTAATHFHRQEELIRYLGATNELARAWHSIFYAFPERYVDSLGDLVYFDWYTACFVADPAHAAMWGNYGNGHKGVCLKFRAEERHGQPPTLRMRGITAWHAGPGGSGPTYGDLVLPFEKMTYTDKLAEIDFFRSIGRISVGALKSEWYTDSDGRISGCAEHVFAQTNGWHQRYWADFHAMTITKLQDWRHEDEYRLILMSPLGTFHESKDRKLTYHFSDLEGSSSASGPRWKPRSALSISLLPNAKRKNVNHLSSARLSTRHAAEK